MKKNFFELMTFVMMTLVCVALVSCGGDDDNDDGTLPLPSNSSNNDFDKYLATNAVKTVELYDAESLGKGVPDYVIKEGNFPLRIYEDFNYKYSLLLSKGKIFLAIYRRENGAWKGYTDSYNLYYSAYDEFGYPQNYYLTSIIDVGKVKDIYSIEDKTKPNNNSTWTGSHDCCGGATAVQPNHGYAMAFITEENIIKYLRVYVKDYSLDTAGSLESIIIDYQLY